MDGDLQLIFASLHRVKVMLPCIIASQSHRGTNTNNDFREPVGMLRVNEP